MNKPRIQVSGGQRLIENYAAAVTAAGGEPLAAYCPQPDLTCDGLLLCGGGDIECTLYGQEDRGSQPPDRDRDQAETTLFRAFFEAGKPILGICRGMQMINIMLGGTMIQDMPASQQIFHSGPDGDRVHPARVLAGSLLDQMYGPCSTSTATTIRRWTSLVRVCASPPGLRAAYPKPWSCPAIPCWGFSSTRSV